MHRVSVVGSSGSGKSTVARAVANRLDVPWIELDAVNHQPDWVPLPVEQFRAEARSLAEEEAWVIDGNYYQIGVLDIVWERADTVVWIDLPKATVMWQLIRRTLHRSITRQVLWNGNRERLRSIFKKKPEDNVVLWAWTRFDEQRERYEAAMADPRWASIEFVRLGSRKEAHMFLSSLA
jgi:adenylate kinase family enzyme